MTDLKKLTGDQIEKLRIHLKKKIRVDYKDGFFDAYVPKWPHAFSQAMNDEAAYEHVQDQIDKYCDDAILYESEVHVIENFSC